jgi:hypothetical protein
MRILSSSFLRSYSIAGKNCGIPWYIQETLLLEGPVGAGGISFLEAGSSGQTRIQLSRQDLCELLYKLAGGTQASQWA